MTEQQYQLSLIPVNELTGERVDLNPSIVKKLDNVEITELYAQLKTLTDLNKKVEAEVKSRLDEGQAFNRLSYGKQAVSKVLTLTNQQKFDLVQKYGWDVVEPLSLAKLKKMFGEGIEQELEQSIVLKPKKPSIVWDKQKGVKMENILPELKRKYPHVPLLGDDGVYYPVTNTINNALDISMA